MGLASPLNFSGSREKTKHIQKLTNYDDVRQTATDKYSNRSFESLKWPKTDFKIKMTLIDKPITF